MSKTYSKKLIGEECREKNTLFLPSSFLFVCGG